MKLNEVIVEAKALGGWHVTKEHYIRRFSDDRHMRECPIAAVVNRRLPEGQWITNFEAIDGVRGIVGPKLAERIVDAADNVSDCDAKMRARLLRELVGEG